MGPQKFFLLVTDNASNMKAAWEIVSTKYPHISCVGCAAHGLNLLLKDFMGEKVFKKINKQSRAICKYVKRTHTIYAAFKNAQFEKYPKNKIISLKVPAKTRWSCLFMTVDSLLRNKEALQTIVLMEHLGVERNIKKVILDDVFWTNLQYVKQILHPIAISIKILESDSSLLSEVVYIFNYIKKTIEESEEGNFKEKLLEYLENRFKFCCKPIHFAANLLDPRFKGKQLNDHEVMIAIDFISQMADLSNLDVGEVVANLAHFRTETGFFSRDTLWKSATSTHPVIWWKGLCTLQPLMKIASRILNGPPSSASAERNWSLHGFVHTNKRNRLTQDKVQKLVAIQSSLMCLNLYENGKYMYDPRPFPLLEQSENVVDLIQDEEGGIVEADSDADAYSESEDSGSDSEEDLPLSFFAK